jgi:hypothetical protein
MLAKIGILPILSALADPLRFGQFSLHAKIVAGVQGLEPWNAGIKIQ